MGYPEKNNRGVEDMGFAGGIDWTTAEKIQTGGGLRAWNFLGYSRKSMWKLQESIKEEVEFVMNWWNSSRSGIGF